MTSEIYKRGSLLFLIATILFMFVSCSNKVKRPKTYYAKPAKENLFSGIKKKIVVLNFFNESPYGGEDLGIHATEELKFELSRTGEFIIDNMALKTFGTSKEVYALGGTKLSQLVRQGKVAGVNFVLFGRVVDARIRESTDEIGIVRTTKSYAESKIEIRIFDINNNKEIYTETLTGFADDNSFRLFNSKTEDRLSYRQDLLRYVVKVAARRAVPAIMDVSSKLDWVGRIAKIMGNKIYVNAGRTSGINIGDILKVITEGSEIYDPDTGALIGDSKGEIKGTIEIIDYFGPDGAVAILHSGGSVLEGDYVQLY